MTNLRKQTWQMLVEWEPKAFYICFCLFFTMWCKYTHILYGLISFLCFPLSQAGYLHVFTHFRQVDLFFSRVFQCEFDAWIGWIPLPRCEIRITLGELKIVFNRIMMLGCRGSNPRIRLILDFQTVHWTVDRALVPIILFRRNDATTSFFKVIEPLQTKLNCSSQATGTEPPKIQFIYSTLKAGGHRSCSIYFYSTTADLSCCFLTFQGVRACTYDCYVSSVWAAPRSTVCSLPLLLAWRCKLSVVEKLLNIMSIALRSTSIFMKNLHFFSSNTVTIKMVDCLWQF